MHNVSLGIDSVYVSLCKVHVGLLHKCASVSDYWESDLTCKIAYGGISAGLVQLIFGQLLIRDLKYPADF